MIEVAYVVEHDNGDATYVFEMDRAIDNCQVEVEETIAGRYEMSNPGNKDYEV